MTFQLIRAPGSPIGWANLGSFGEKRDYDRNIYLFAARQLPGAYFLRTNAGPLTRFPLRSTVTSTVSAILTKGMPLVIP